MSTPLPENFTDATVSATNHAGAHNATNARVNAYTGENFIINRWFGDWDPMYAPYPAFSLTEHDGYVWTPLEETSDEPLMADANWFRLWRTTAT